MYDEESGILECVPIRQNRIRLIRVPAFVAKHWLASPPNAVVSVLLNSNKKQEDLDREEEEEDDDDDDNSSLDDDSAGGGEDNKENRAAARAEAKRLKRQEAEKKHLQSLGKNRISAATGGAETEERLIVSGQSAAIEAVSSRRMVPTVNAQVLSAFKGEVAALQKIRSLKLQTQPLHSANVYIMRKRTLTLDRPDAKKLSPEKRQKLCQQAQRTGQETLVCEGQVRASVRLVPELNSEYHQLLKCRHVRAVSRERQTLTSNNIDRGDTSGQTYLFRYYQNGLLADGKDGEERRGRGRPKAQSRSDPTMSEDALKQKLFALFESRDAEGLSLKDLVKATGQPQGFVRQVAEQIADLKRRKDTKKQSYVLKAEFSADGGEAAASSTVSEPSRRW